MPTVTICQPRYLPWMGYFDRLLKSDIYIILDTVQYASSDYENRNQIKTPDGAKWLSVPTAAPKGTLAKDAKIDTNQAWNRKHWMTIEQHYRKAPFWEEIAPRVKLFYTIDWTSLYELNKAMLNQFCNLLDITPRVVRSSKLEDKGLTGSQLLLDLCSQVGGTVYLSGAPGLDYLNEELFDYAGIKVEYQDYDHPIYPQLWGEFIPGLAIIDLLFNCGIDKSKDIIRGKL